MNVKKGMKFITLLLAVMVCISMPIDKFVINEVIPMSTVEAASIKLNKKTATVVIGKKVTLKVSGTKKKVTWASANKSVATVTAKGVVTGKKAGTATIKAKVSGKTLKCKITVKESPKLSSTKCSMFWGTTKTLKVTGTNKKVKWTTSDSSIVTVTKQGKLTAKKSGKETVAATVGSKKLKCTVTVKNRITVSTNAITIEEGKTYNLKVKYVGDGTISWKCGNTDIVQPSWKEGWEGNYTTLKIKGLEAGKTTVALVNTLNNEKVRIKVTVKSKEEIMALKVKIILKNKLPQKFTNSTYSGSTYTTYNLTGFTYDVEYNKYDNDYDVTVYFTGQKLYDRKGDGQSRSLEIGWKLYDEDGYVVDSDTTYTSSLAPGDKFKNEKDYIWDLKESGKYVLEILSTN